MKNTNSIFNANGLSKNQRPEKFLACPLGNAFHLIFAYVEHDVAEVIIWRDMETYSGALVQIAYGKNFKQLIKQICWEDVQHVIDRDLTRPGEKFVLTDMGVCRV